MLMKYNSVPYSSREIETAGDEPMIGYGCSRKL
jgi:hypothetical protein